MLKRLHIQNFQSHQNSVLHFDSGVNVIFGLSQAGKTAVIRALRLLFQNRPLGGRFFSDFAGDIGETKVELELDRGEKIAIVKKIRNKGEKVVVESSYFLNGQEFSGMKDQVPDQVLDALNLSELNLQRQLDEPFLISSSSGEIARVINRITKLEKIDEWVSNLTTSINQTNREIMRLDGEVKLQKIELEKYNRLDEVEEILKQLQEADAEVKQIERQRLQLDELLEKAERTTKRLAFLEGFMYIEKFLEKAEKIDSEIEDFEKTRVKIERAAGYTDRIKQLASCVFSIEILVNKIEELEDDSERRQYLELKGACRKYETLVDEDLVLGERLEAIRESYLHELEKIGKCPTCYSEITKAQLKKIKDEL